ncbi:MAG: N-acetylmuramoyl-L-alanine amidase [Rickettsiales bacterium]|jgi:N-acetylmuramoyl-L-alanine amidase|nr:N-acetylmuramoyl-L-alanine amidase [Rickettsiales bacterium]
MKFVKSPNFSIRNQAINSIVLHYTQVNLNETLKIFLDSKSELSSHYIVTEEGEVIQMVKDGDVAWHAGLSSWRGKEQLNQSSIGIEIVNNGESLYPDIQIKALICLLDELREKFDIDNINIVGHSDIAPLRKTDPGKLFPWRFLASNNHGIYITYDELQNSDLVPKETDLKNALCKLGYSHNYCINSYDLKNVRSAFLSHFANDFKFTLSELEIIKLINVILAKI